MALESIFYTMENQTFQFQYVLYNISTIFQFRVIGICSALLILEHIEIGYWLFQLFRHISCETRTNFHSEKAVGKIETDQY